MPAKKLKDGTTVPQKQNGGRPKKDLQQTVSKQVYKLAKIGATLNEIADFLSVDVNTVRRNYKAELVKGKADVRLRLRKAQLQAAIEDRQPTMLVWLGKNMLGQSDMGVLDEDELLDDVEFSLDDSSSISI